jgi:hypothetical protein
MRVGMVEAAVSPQIFREYLGRELNKHRFR